MLTRRVLMYSFFFLRSREMNKMFVQNFRDDVKCDCVLIVSKKAFKTVLKYNQNAFTFDIISKVLYKHFIRC